MRRPSRVPVTAAARGRLTVPCGGGRPAPLSGRSGGRPALSSQRAPSADLARVFVYAFVHCQVTIYRHLWLVCLLAETTTDVGTLHNRVQRKTTFFGKCKVQLVENVRHSFK